MSSAIGTERPSHIGVRGVVELAAVAVLVGGSLLLGAAPAAAATSVGRTSSTLQITARAGVANDIRITVSGADFVVTDSADTVRPGSTCVAVDASTVRCVRLYADVISVNLGDRNDVVFADTSTRTVLRGEAGDDELTAGGPNPESVQHIGGPGNDTVRGGAGIDVINGGPGSDSLRGGAGQDYALYTSRTVAVRVDADGTADDGEPGEKDNVHPDVEGVSGGRGNDVLSGSAAANHLSGGPGNDRLIGLGGNDSLVGGSGDDAVSGGAGDDLSYYGGAFRYDGTDVFAGGAGSDTGYYGIRKEAVQVSLDGVADDGAVGERDNNRRDVENIRSGWGRDVLIGNASANLLHGSFGNDRLVGLGGDDSLGGDTGNDVLSAGDGDDLLDGAVGGDTMYGAAGNDLLLGGPGPSAGPDQRIVHDADRLSGGDGVDTVSYCCRFEGVTVDPDGQRDDGWVNEQDLVGANIENLEGGPSADVLRGSDAANVIMGNGGNDVITGLGGPDTLDGGAGNDSLNSVDGVSGNDAMSGGAQTDRCAGDTGDTRVECER